MHPRQLAALKVLLFLAALLPLARLFAFGVTDQLGANPIEFITRNTGSWALYFLCLGLSITPMRRLTGWNSVSRFRRMVGLFTFFYAALHFTTFLWFDHFFDLAGMWRDVLKRPFITVGFIAFLLLIPLAATSADRVVRWMGGKSWRRLHSTIYLIAPLAILHFWWMKAGKNDFEEPLIFGMIVAALLLLRVYWRLRRARSPALR